MPEVVVFGISFRFRRLSRCEGQIAHVLLTRSPLVYSRRSLTARLACVKHAASVRPEPGSNSPLKIVDARSARPSVHRLLEYPGKSGHGAGAMTRCLTKGTVRHEPSVASHRRIDAETGRFKLIRRRLLAHC